METETAAMDHTAADGATAGHSPAPAVGREGNTANLRTGPGLEPAAGTVMKGRGARLNLSQSMGFNPTPPSVITGEFAVAGMTDKGDGLWEKSANFPNTAWTGVAPSRANVSGYSRVILTVPGEVGNIAEIARSMNTGDWTPKWATNFGTSRHHGKPGTLAAGIAWLEARLDPEWVAKIVGQIIERERTWAADEAKGQGN